MIIQMRTHLDLEDGLVRTSPYERQIFLTLGIMRVRVELRLIFLLLDLDQYLDMIDCGGLLVVISFGSIQ